MFERHNFKIFRCNPNDPNFDLFKFVGEINLHISKLREKYTANSVIDKIAKDFEKIVAVTKSIELKRYAKNILPNYREWKTRNKNKTNKNWEKTWRKDFTYTFRPQEIKMANKVFREKFNCLVCRSNNPTFYWYML